MPEGVQSYRSVDTQPDSTLPQGISVVVPVFRYSDSLTRLVEDLLNCQAKYPLEVIIVDDSGLRTTWEKIRELQSLRRESVSCIRLGKNVGQHAALFAGTRFSHFQ